MNPKSAIVVFLFFVSTLLAHAQSGYTIDIKACQLINRLENDRFDNQQLRDTSIVFHVVEEMPAFPGGEIALSNFVSKLTSEVTNKDQSDNIPGRVICRFVVEKDGRIGKIDVLRSISTRDDEEAIRIVKSLPRFTPGKQNGKSVRVYYTLPITFVSRQLTQNNESNTRL